MKSPVWARPRSLRCWATGRLSAAVPDMQYKFRLIIGPLTLEDYLRFLPGGNNLPVLTELVRTFIGFEYCWEIELQLKPHAAPPAVIGGAQQLGWTALGR